MDGAGADDGGEDDPDKGAAEPVVGVAVVAKTFREVAVGEPEREGEPDPVGMDLERTEVEDDGYWLHGSLMFE